MLKTETFADAAKLMPFYLTAAKKQKTQFKNIFPEKGTVFDVTEQLARFAFSVKPSQVQMEFGDLSQPKRILPRQKISPVQFEIRNNKLAVVDKIAHPRHEDETNIKESKAILLSRGEFLISELQRSNCDKRLIDSIVELQSGLGTQSNIIKLGLVNIACESLCTAFDSELSDALRGMLIGHTRGVSMYVAQFPEWERFSENAAAVSLNQDDIVRISETAKTLAAKLEANPDVAEAGVPATIRALQLLIANPAFATKRATFAVLRTIENLVSKAIQYGVDLIEKTATNTVDGLSRAASRIIIVSLLTLALGSAIEISPLAAKISDTAWLRAAVEIVQKQIEQLEK